MATILELPNELIICIYANFLTAPCECLRQIRLASLGRRITEPVAYLFARLILCMRRAAAWHSAKHGGKAFFQHSTLAARITQISIVLPLIRPNHGSIAITAY
jgi:hypothetical protein